MKFLIYLSLFVALAMNEAKAQLIIVTDEKSVNITESTLLQFEDNNSKGIILPANTTTSTEVTNGTFMFDQTDAKVKMYENNSWIDLSDTGDKSSIITNSSTDNGEGVIVGSEKTDAKGILVLESTDKAMVLPRVNDVVNDIISPYPGLMCYDITSKTIAFFDGKVWNFWK